LAACPAYPSFGGLSGLSILWRPVRLIHPLAACLAYPSFSDLSGISILVGILWLIIYIFFKETAIAKTNKNKNSMKKKERKKSQHTPRKEYVLVLLL
jgi:hypothetical protein